MIVLDPDSIIRTDLNLTLTNLQVNTTTSLIALKQ